MSSDNGEAPSAHNVLANKNLRIEESVPCDLESLAMVALQELGKERGKKEGIAAMTHEEGLQIQDRKNSTDKGTIAINPTPSTCRIVSVDCSCESRVEEKETISSTSKAESIIKFHTPLGDNITDATASTEGPSPSTFLSSLPPSITTTSNDKVKDTLISTKDKDDRLKVADFSAILSNPEGWLQQTENMFAKLPPLDHISDDIIVRPNDVLCGRGGETNHHPGNVKYRSLVKVYQKLYLLAKRRDKPKIAQCIVVSVRGVNGRFLKRMKDSKKISIWIDVGNVKAREKTSQALREGAPDLRETVNTSPSTNHPGNHVLTQERKERNIVSSSAMTPTFDTLRSNNNWQTAKFNSADSTRNANRPTSPVSSSSSSPTSTQLYTDRTAFTNAMRTQHQAMLFRAAQATALKTAQRTSTSTTIQGTAPPLSGPCPSYDAYWRHIFIGGSSSPHVHDNSMNKHSAIGNIGLPSDLTTPIFLKFHDPPSEAAVASYGTSTIAAVKQSGEAHTTSTLATNEHEGNTNMRLAADRLFGWSRLKGHTSNTKKTISSSSFISTLCCRINELNRLQEASTFNEPTHHSFGHR
uniref:DUF6824 domain-containing protein n=1 Tax=Pseudo-nitzschia australis TaxID=44445 RepID=A0A7S4AYR2_9STRA|mmetsp:Transcript_7387/g.14541  ORF Transcript_7387/g.14541 Transcript_7387/m.14541 type:complete len:582 (-) Transcript_7387:772-2517(-)